MPTCRLCPRLADSAEHVILSALGGRLVVCDLLCTTCNGSFGHGIDAKVARQFEAFRMMLAVEGDRGQVASVQMRAADGRAVILDPGMGVRAAPVPPVIQHRDGEEVRARFNSIEEARTYNEAVQRKNPHRKVIVSGVTESISFPGQLSYNFELGGDAYFRNSVKSVLALLAERGLDGPPAALTKAWRYVAGEPATESGVSVFLAATTGPWSPEELGSVSHRIAVRSNVARGFIEADVRYFGEIGVVIRIACPVERPFAIAYGIDPIRGSSASCDEWEGAIGIPRAAEAREIYRMHDRAFAAILLRARERETELLSKRILEEARERALSVFPEGEAHELFRPLLLRLCNDEVGRILNRREESHPAPELLPRLQPRSNR